MNLDTLTACAICGYALIEIHTDGQVSYQHPVSESIRRHDPVPVDASGVADLFHRCHICSGPHPVWNYRTAELEALGLGGVRDIVQTYNTQWHVCYPCAQLIEADDSDTLTDRSAARMGWHPADPRAAILRLLHRGIVVTREPQRTLLTTTDWPPATITPETMPKIRDRLTGLVRGPANLPDPINDRDGREVLAATLDRAPLYWINQEFTDLITEVTGDQPPTAVTDRITPSVSGLIAWQRPIGHDGRIAAVSWRPAADGWDILCYRSIGAALTDDLMPTLRHEIGWLVPIHTEAISQGALLDGHHALGPLVTTWLLIAQQLAETTPAKLPKAVRRAYQRSQRPAPDVRLVQIKPTTRPPGVERAEPAGSDRSRAKPSHRFWVTGHERNQAYGPGRSLRRKITIEPFLKGPDDQPIKLSTTVRMLGKRKPISDAEPEQ